MSCKAGSGHKAYVDGGGCSWAHGKTWCNDKKDHSNAHGQHWAVRQLPPRQGDNPNYLRTDYVNLPGAEKCEACS